MSAIERNDRNPPAFPTEIDFMLEPGEAMQTGARTAQYSGMSLRDWFAGQALAMSQPDRPGYLADWAYRVADAMLAARSTFNDADNQREEGK